MRDIKFRFLDGNTWVYWTSDDTASPYSGDFTFWQRYDSYGTPDTLGQFTGMQDANKQDIYEGDIVSLNGTIDVVEFGKIGYDAKWNGLTGFGLKSWYDSYYEGEDFYELCYYSDTENIEVIGNIHENPELLK